MPSVLIVDDSAIMRKNLKAILTKSGYNVIAEASNGEDAYQTYAEHRPDLVTMDVTMPVLDGIQAVKKIIHDYPEAKIVVISAFDQRSMLFQALENGAKNYIIKPITAEKLLQVLSQILEDGDSGEQHAAPSTTEAAAQEAAPAIQPVPEVAEKTPHVSIENRNGTFVIQIVQDVSHSYLDALQMTVQGLLFIKPLSLVLRMEGVSVSEPQLLARLREIIATVRSAGGTVEIEAADAALYAAMNEGG